MALAPGATPSPTTLIVHVASAGTVWWATAIIGGAFTLVGVGIAQFVSWQLERQRRVRDRAARHDAFIRELVPVFLQRLDEMLEQLERVPSASAADRMVISQKFDSQIQQFGSILTPMEIAIPSEIYQKARLIHFKIFAMNGLIFPLEVLEVLEVEGDQSLPTLSEGSLADLRKQRRGLVNLIRNHFDLEDVPLTHS